MARDVRLAGLVESASNPETGRRNDGQPICATGRDFWQWAGSDLVSNTFRGWLAEFLVAQALDGAGGVSHDWEAYDLQIEDMRIEVKASGYVQSWTQERLSERRFAIRAARAWDSETDTLSDRIGRHSDLYVFCLHDHKHQPTLDPLDVGAFGSMVMYD